MPTHEDANLILKSFKAANAMIEWKKTRSAEGFEAFSKRVLGH
jgi:hypothetical protein